MAPARQADVRLDHLPITLGLRHSESSPSSGSRTSAPSGGAGYVFNPSALVIALIRVGPPFRDTTGIRRTVRVAQRIRHTTFFVVMLLARSTSARTQ